MIKLIKSSRVDSVHALLSDYGKNGLRVRRFFPKKNRIDVQAWDPVKGKLCEETSVVKDRDQH